MSDEFTLVTSKSQMYSRNYHTKTLST